MKPSSSTVESHAFQRRLEAYGCSDFIRLDEPLSEPAQLGYLDLLPRAGNGARSVAVAAVAEHQGTALLYLMDGGMEAGGGDAAQIAKIQRLLANRSDPAWLGVVRAGSLDIYPIGFHEKPATAPVAVIQGNDTAACLFFQSLVHGTFSENGRLNGSDYVFKKIFGLLTQTTDAFVPKDGKGKLEPLHVLSMAGRALFFRFLIDRRIVLDGEIQEICPDADNLKDTFSNAEKAAKTSAWLDKTFNGDFLQLVDESIPRDDEDARKAAYLSFYQETERLVGQSIFDHLHAILRGWPATGGAIQQELDWGDFDFAHVPVGVLSQVYESFSHRANPDEAKTNSVHYTPRSVAGLMIEQSFAALEDRAKVRVLDPACGAGIFLVLAFRRLVSERWQHDEQRPNTAVIQEILYRQLRGYDVSEPALRLAALALYITAIEVNGSPRPPKNLKFPKNLRDAVLFRFGEGTPTGFTIGSLAAEVSSDRPDRFDLVIGNPPWTRLREPKREANEDDGEEEPRHTTDTAKLSNEFTAIGRRVLNGRGLMGLAKKYQNPNNNPDLPFLWRAMEWAKQDGIIALAMPARIFGRTSGKGYDVWQAVLRSVQVTGLINGADLRKTPVWEDIDMPFCVLFARNALPKAKHRFQYASPLYEPDLNGWARFRIDEEATQPISVDRVEQQPWLLKTLSLGTWLDVEVIESLLKAFPGTLRSYWKSWNPTRNRTGKGYTLSRDLRQKQVPFLGELKDFCPPESGFSIDFERLSTFVENHGKATVYRSRGIELYEPPLVFVPKAPGEESTTPKAYFSQRTIAFSQSYYGYSCAGNAESEILASLIYLLAHSTLFRYFALMVSVSQGADHMIFTKQDFDALPFPDLATLSPTQKTDIRELRGRIESESSGALDQADAFLFHLYGLDGRSVQVIKDTLYSSIPYRKAGRDALERTQHETRTEFIAELQESLEPYFDVCGEHCTVQEAAFQPDEWSAPWYFLAVSRDADSVPVDANLLREAMKIANQHGSSRIVVQAPNRHGLLLGLLNRRRWWTRTRAFLCGQHIIRHHLSAFGLPEEV